MKREGLANIMKRMAEKAGIKNKGSFTNTSGRKTAIQPQFNTNTERNV